VLAAAAATGLGVLAAGPSYAVSDARRSVPGPGQPRIAIVGAGLAGLTCAFRLYQQGIASTVFEAHDSRVGGRCWTARGFVDGETAEHGGEFIDSAHHRIRSLAAELGLTLDDVDAARRRHRRQHGRIYLDGAVRRHADVYGHEELLRRQAREDYARIGSWRWNRAGRAAHEMDEMTAREWLDRALPSSGDHLLKLATAQYISEEYGLDPDRLSAITMVWEFGPVEVPSDERFHVHGGNDQIPHGLVDRLPAGTVRPGHALRTLTRRRDSSHRLLFHGSDREVAADLVVLCLPFTALRAVDVRAAGLSDRKRRCIDELGMGTNAKILIQFDHHLGHYDRFDGVYSDEHVDTWNSSIDEAGTAGLLTVYSGGRTGARYPVDSPHGPAPAAIVRRTTEAISRAVPGLARGYDGNAWLDHWASDPWTHGSYAAFLPGQFTRYFGFVGLAEGGVHFGGEHNTATAALGYLEGAVRSGERCAREVAAQALRLRGVVAPFAQ
jgi:monoamine oxidase